MRSLIATGDTRWIERGAHDLLDVDPDATRSAAGMPRARALYGAAARAARGPGLVRVAASGTCSTSAARTGSPSATQVDIPQVAHPSMLVMVHRLDGGDAALEDAPLQITVLNFSAETIDGTVRSDSLVPRSGVIDAESGESVGRVDDLQSFPLQLGPYEGRFLIFEAPEPEELHPVTRAIHIIPTA